MSETLLDKAVGNYNVAVMIRNQMGDDEVYLNYIGYHLQQAVELCLKHQLEAAGVSYPKTHDIDQLVLIGTKNGITLQLTPYIEDHSEMFSLWESRTRYVLDYQLEKSKVDKAMEEVGRFLSVALEREQERTAEPQKELADQILEAIREKGISAHGAFEERTEGPVLVVSPDGYQSTSLVVDLTGGAVSVERDGKETDLSELVGCEGSFMDRYSQFCKIAERVIAGESPNQHRKVKSHTKGIHL